MKWEQIPLGDLYTVHNGLSKGRKFFGKGFPFLSFSTVFNNFFLPMELPDLVESSIKEQESYSIKRGDIFITRTSETSDELGMSSVALKDYPNATYNGFTKRMRPLKENVVWPEYIGYYMRTPLFRAEFNAFSTMTTRASLRNEDLLSIKVALPTLEIQKRIASILSAYDDLIENNQKQIKLLEEGAQRLYKEWFVDLRFPGHENVKIVDGVPEGWENTILDEVIEFNPSISLSKERIKECVPMSALSTSAMTLDINEISYAKSNSGSRFQNNDTIMARITPCLENGKIAFVQELQSEEGAVGSTEYIVMRSKSLCPPMVYLLARTHNFRQYAINSMSGSDGRQRVKVERLREYEYLKPDATLIEEFSGKVTPFFKRIKDLSKANIVLQEARDRLLPKLMSGEIEV